MFNDVCVAFSDVDVVILHIQLIGLVIEQKTVVVGNGLG